MQLDPYDLVGALQALPETHPVDIEGIAFGARTCQSQCVGLTVNVIQTVCVIVASCK